MIKRTESSNSVLIDPEFKETVNRAQMIIGEMTQKTGGNKVDFVTAPIMSVLLSVFYTKKNRIIEATLPILQKLIHSSIIPYDTPIILYQSHSSKEALLCGNAFFNALGDFIIYTSDYTMQLKGIETLHDLVSDDKFPSFTGKCVTRCVQICCQLTLQSSNEEVRAISRDLLLLCVLRVTRAFIEIPPPECRISTFTTYTLLDDYIHDVEADANFTRIEVESVTSPLSHENIGERLNENVPIENSTKQDINDDKTTSNSSFHPLDYFRSSLDDSIMASALSALQSGGKFPNSMKDLVLLIKHTCRLATRTCSGSGSTNEGNPEVRARQLALEMLESIFLEIPVANCDLEHNCSTWLSLVLSATRYDLLRCIARNISTIIPSCFFTISIRIITLLLRKCHFHIARELHSLLAVMVFPLAQSKFSSFSQKHAVLGMVREIVSIPHLCVSFFINYDCNPTFDPGAKYGGMLELIVDFIVEMIYADFFDSEWLSSDQQQLLRSECASAMHSLVESMLRWVSEDPKEYAQQQIREVAGQVLNKTDNFNRLNNKWYKDSLDNWELKDNDQDIDTSDLMSDEISLASLNDNLVNNSKLLGKEKNIGYHWKHIHYLLQNKRIAQEALQLINKGRWREGMEFLKKRQYISSLNDKECFTDFARFLKTYAGVERSTLCMIFERVLKDPDCDSILKSYLELFHYEGVPIDIALRDTTCEFMSWDRPTFEAQVWGIIQERFGEVYAAQNPRNITIKDANAMAGVLLFLHTSLHNAGAKNSRMTMEEFVKNGNACVEFPFPEEEMREMFQRVARQKWELDAFHRTPHQVEVEHNSKTSLSARIHQHYYYHQQQQLLMRNSVNASVTELLSEGGRSPSTQMIQGESGINNNNNNNNNNKSYNISNISTNSSSIKTQHRWSVQDKIDDSTFLDTAVPPYTTNPEGFKLRESYHQRYVDIATQHLWRLECEHRMQNVDRAGAQPYIIPYYAQHIRPMLLMLYPQIAAALYMGFRVLEEQPIFRLLLSTYQMLFDVAAAFVVNLSGLRVAVERKIQRCLLEEGAQQLPPPIRATFTLPLMNLI